MQSDLPEEVKKAHRDACREGKDFYRDPSTKMYVFTALGLMRVGMCCHNGCRHCPYLEEEIDGPNEDS